MRRALLIVNPFATVVTTERVRAVEAALRPVAELRVERTQAPGHATELARDALGVDAVFVFSGDGGFNEALNGAGSQVPLGFLPGGGSSVLSRLLGVPRDPVRAAERLGAALAGGRTRRISLGRVNGRRFGFTAGVGFDAEAVRRMDVRGRAADGARPGDAAFVRTVARMLLERRGRFDPVLEVEGLGRAAFALVANADPYTYLGRLSLHVAPEARFELGLDVVAPVRVRPLGLPRLLAYAATGRGGLGQEDVLIGHDLDRLRVVCDRPLPLHVDGEDLGDVDEALFEAERHAVSVLV